MNGVEVVRFLPPAETPQLWCFDSPDQLPPRNLVKYVTLVLDLDETLIYARCESLIAIRPGVRKFLYVCTILGAEIIVWSAATQDHVRSVVNILDPNRNLISFAIYRSTKWLKDDRIRKHLSSLDSVRYSSSILLEDHFWSAAVNGNMALLLPKFNIPNRETATSISKFEELILEFDNEKIFSDVVTPYIMRVLAIAKKLVTCSKSLALNIFKYAASHQRAVTEEDLNYLKTEKVLQIEPEIISGLTSLPASAVSPTPRHRKGKREKMLTIGEFLQVRVLEDVSAAHGVVSGNSPKRVKTQEVLNVTGVVLKADWEGIYSVIHRVASSFPTQTLLSYLELAKSGKVNAMQLETQIFKSLFKESVRLIPTTWKTSICDMSFEFKCANATNTIITRIVAI